MDRCLFTSQQQPSALPSVATQPSDQSLFIACWQLSDFYQFIALAWDKVWSRPLDRSPHTEYLQSSVCSSSVAFLSFFIEKGVSPQYLGHQNTECMQPLVCPPLVVLAWPSEYPSTVSPLLLVWSPSAAGWIYAFPGPLCLPRRRTWDSFLGLGLFPQPQVGASLGSSTKGFAFGLGLVPQPAAAPSPSSLGSLVLWLWVITPFYLGITQLGPPSICGGLMLMKNNKC